MNNIRLYITAETVREDGLVLRIQKDIPLDSESCFDGDNLSMEASDAILELMEKGEEK